MVHQSADHYYLWRQTHKDLAHQLKELQRVEQRVLYIKRELNALELKGEGVKECLAALEATDTRFRGLVLKIVHNLTTHSAQLDLFWQIISSLLLSGRSVGGGGTGPSHDVVESEGEPGPGSPSSSCPSLISLQSSWLDSPTLDTPTDPPRTSSSRAPLEEDDWLRAVLSSISAAAVENGGDTGLPGGGGPIWDMGGGAQLGEEMEMHRIPVNHNVLGCQNCNLLDRPIEYCKDSQYHPSHPLHQRPMSQACNCLH